MASTNLNVLHHVPQEMRDISEYMFQKMNRMFFPLYNPVKPKGDLVIILLKPQRADVFSQNV